MRMPLCHITPEAAVKWRQYVNLLYWLVPGRSCARASAHYRRTHRKEETRNANNNATLLPAKRVHGRTANLAVDSAKNSLEIKSCGRTYPHQSQQLEIRTYVHVLDRLVCLKRFAFR